METCSELVLGSRRYECWKKVCCIGRMNEVLLRYIFTFSTWFEQSLLTQLQLLHRIDFVTKPVSAVKKDWKTSLERLSEPHSSHLGRAPVFYSRKLHKVKSRISKFPQWYDGG